MKGKVIYVILGLVLFTAITIAGCTDTPQSDTPPTTIDANEPTDREMEIAKTFHVRLWELPVGDTGEENRNAENELKREIAGQYGITPEELSDIYDRAIDYNLKQYGTITGNW